MRPHAVARLAKVQLSQVIAASLAEVIKAYQDRQDDQVLQALEQAPAAYWQVGDTYYFDDEEFGEVVAIDQLVYDPTLGLVAP